LTVDELAKLHKIVPHQRRYFETLIEVLRIEGLAQVVGDEVTLRLHAPLTVDQLCSDAKDLYSNAVIEHVGNFDDQRRFLSELFRVSRRGYLTTPNRHFPIELHTRIPLLHLLLSKKNFDAFVTKIGKGWAAGDYMSLLSENDLRRLFQEVGISNYTLIKNRFCGLPMTFTLIWHKD
jgi:hypothetical protein